MVFLIKSSYIGKLYTLIYQTIINYILLVWSYAVLKHFAFSYYITNQQFRRLCCKLIGYARQSSLITCNVVFASLETVLKYVNYSTITIKTFKYKPMVFCLLLLTSWLDIAYLNI